VKYMIPAQFLERPARVAVIGAGGTGSALLGGLAQMAVALRELGGQGLEVAVVDDDRVSKANIGRQAFVASDVGQSKAKVIVNRLNQCYGLDWRAYEVRLEPDTEWGYNWRPDIYIGCVDTRSARSAIRKQWTEGVSGRNPDVLWLDCGNSMSAGQVVLGARQHRVIKNGGSPGKGAPWVPQVISEKTVLPAVSDLFPETADATLDSSNDGPSCSLPEALRKQDLFTNRHIADAALNILWQLFRYGELEIHGAFINLRTMRTNPIAIDPLVWTRMGWAQELEKGPETPPAPVKGKRRREAAAA